VKNNYVYQNPAVQLFECHGAYRENGLNSEMIKHSEILPLLEKYSGTSVFRIEKLGESVEEREINSIVFGTGQINILAWSQMHGDEPTATAAIFDLLKFFSADDEFNKIRELLLNKLTFHFIPMLNPDGAEIFRRENAFNVDLNRDALRLQSPESKILWDYSVKTSPEFGFNLHDQNNYYGAGRSGNTAAISLLAPPSSYSKNIGYTREKSMQVISRIYDSLSLFVPGSIARYNDDFEPRAFGDNLVKSGISVILIESGFIKNDTGKEIIRKLNFEALLTAFVSIARDDFASVDYRGYFNIPENRELFFDLLLRNLNIRCGKNYYMIDIGINREKSFDHSECLLRYKGKITEVGDLSIYYGIEEADLAGYRIVSPEMPMRDGPGDLRIARDEEISIEVTNGFLKYL